MTRLVLTGETGPFSPAGVDAAARLADQVRRRLPAALEGAEVLPSGTAAGVADLRAVARRDRRVVAAAVVLAVLATLWLVLRQAAVCVLLVAAVLFSFLATFGLTDLIFAQLRGEPFAGLDWTVPTLLFALLAAVGVDYSVLLVERVSEEQEASGPCEGVRRGVAATGSLISGAGLIMAGTFAILLVNAELDGLRELGAVLTLGVLMDTFVVRPLLVPGWLLTVNSGWFGRCGRWLGGAAGGGIYANLTQRTAAKASPRLSHGRVRGASSSEFADGPEPRRVVRGERSAAPASGPARHSRVRPA